jgi:hypothetical protein
MKYKTPMFDENNKQLKESLTSSHVLNSLAKEMCFRFNLKVLGATRTRNPYSQDLEIDDGSDIANIYGEDTKSNRKGYILGKEGYPVGFISTFYSQRYDCEQFIYSQHTESRDSDTSIKCVKSKSMNTLLSRVKKYFYKINVQWIPCIREGSKHDGFSKRYSGKTSSFIPKPSSISSQRNGEPYF